MYEAKRTTIIVISICPIYPEWSRNMTATVPNFSSCVCWFRSSCKQFLTALFDYYIYTSSFYNTTRLSAYTHLTSFQNTTRLSVCTHCIIPEHDTPKWIYCLINSKNDTPKWLYILHHSRTRHI